MAFENPFKSLPKPVVVGGIAVTTVITGFLLYRHHKSTGSWFGGGTSSSAAGAIDPVTGLPASEDNTQDPITGLTYLAEAQEYGSVATAEASVSEFGASSATGSGIGVQPAGNSAGVTSLAPGAVGASTYTSNAAWSQAAIAGLADIGYSETDVATAIGDVLEGVPVTSVQAGYYNTAVAEYGTPPQPVPPLTLIPATAASTTTTGSAPSAPVSPVNPPPSSPPASPPPTAPAPPKGPAVPAMPGGVSTSAVTSTGFTVHWSPVAGATSYRVRVTYQSALVWNKTVSGTSVTAGGLTGDHTYTIHVAAIGPGGTSAETNGPAVKTT